MLLISYNFVNVSLQMKLYISIWMYIYMWKHGYMFSNVYRAVDQNKNKFDASKCICYAYKKGNWFFKTSSNAYSHTSDYYESENAISHASNQYLQM